MESNRFILFSKIANEIPNVDFILLLRILLNNGKINTVCSLKQQIIMFYRCIFNFFKRTALSSLSCCQFWQIFFIPIEMIIIFFFVLLMWWITFISRLNPTYIRFLILFWYCWMQFAKIFSWSFMSLLMKYICNFLFL